VIVDEVVRKVYDGELDQERAVDGYLDAMADVHGISKNEIEVIYETDGE